MTRNSVRFHRIQTGETPRSIARRYRLASWSALVRAPHNEALAGVSEDTQLESGTTVRIPPDARTLLKQRVFELQRVQALLRQHFHEQERILAEQVMPLEVIGRLDQRETVATLLGALALQVRRDVELAHVASRALADANEALALTHLRDEGDLARYAGANSAYVGLNWLLTPDLLELWYAMWAPEFWTGRWRGKSAAEAKESVAVHLNLVRSKVLQQADQRLRETNVAIWQLDAAD